MNRVAGNLLSPYLGVQLYAVIQVTLDVSAIVQNAMDFNRILEALKTLALEDGIPYQTLVASILHKYINGKLVEVSTRNEND